MSIPRRAPGPSPALSHNIDPVAVAGAHGLCAAAVPLAVMNTTFGYSEPRAEATAVNLLPPFVRAADPADVGNRS